MSNWKVYRRLLPWTLVLLLAMPLPAAAEDDSALEDFFDLFNLTEREAGWYTVVDQEGNVLMRTARYIHPGDRWIGADNRRYEIYQVEADTAYARYSPPKDSSSLRDRLLSFLSGLWPGSRSVQEGEDVNRRIAVYNTHGAEAYVPSDGKESDPDGGGIIDVADSFAQALEEQGIEVAQNRNTHVPHDAGAYKRSRDTVQELLAEGVDATIDVHRDAIPAEEYLAEVEGQETVQIQLVVGRQNQNQDVIQQFAEELKQVADEMYPGLIKGIFSAKGSYNQDMTPNSILIEVGTHENDKEGAQEAVVLFADVLSSYLYETDAGQERAAGESSGGVFRTILWILGIVIVGGGIFLYISAGSWPEMKRKLQGFTRGEFGDLFKARLKNRGNDDRED